MKIISCKTWKSMNEQIAVLERENDLFKKIVSDLRDEVKKLTPVRDEKGRFVKRSSI